MELTAYMGSSDKMYIPIQIKPKATKQAVNDLETIATSGNRSQFIVKSFNKPTVSSPMKVVFTIV